jgi:ADP-heptose:LPS heptosyltransferase
MAAALGTPLVALFGPQAHLLASMAGERRGDLGRRFRRFPTRTTSTPTPTNVISI